MPDGFEIGGKRRRQATVRKQQETQQHILAKKICDRWTRRAAYMSVVTADDKWYLVHLIAEAIERERTKTV
jgi:hypothetical protein